MTSRQLRRGREHYIVVLVLVIFFVISLFTNILGPIIPEIIRSFQLSLTAAGFLPFAFFLAYGLMSIPSGLLIEALSEKTIIVGAFLLSLAGALAFALFPKYSVATTSLPVARSISPSIPPWSSWSSARHRSSALIFILTW
jgi:fucose permease